MYLLSLDYLTSNWKFWIRASPRGTLSKNDGSQGGEKPRSSSSTLMFVGYECIEATTLSGFRSAHSWKQSLRISRPRSTSRRLSFKLRPEFDRTSGWQAKKRSWILVLVDRSVFKDEEPNIFAMNASMLFWYFPSGLSLPILTSSI